MKIPINKIKEIPKNLKEIGSLLGTYIRLLLEVIINPKIPMNKLVSRCTSIRKSLSGKNAWMHHAPPMMNRAEPAENSIVMVKKSIPEK